jgi:hypothetical protein
MALAEGAMMGETVFMMVRPIGSSARRRAGGDAGGTSRSSLAPARFPLARE